MSLLVSIVVFWLLDLQGQQGQMGFHAIFLQLGKVCLGNHFPQCGSKLQASFSNIFLYFLENDSHR